MLIALFLLACAPTADSGWAPAATVTTRSAECAEGETAEIVVPEGAVFNLEVCTDLRCNAPAHAYSRDGERVIVSCQGGDRVIARWVGP